MTPTPPLYPPTTGIVNGLLAAAAVNALNANTVLARSRRFAEQRLWLAVNLDDDPAALVFLHSLETETGRMRLAAEKAFYAARSEEEDAR